MFAQQNWSYYKCDKISIKGTWTDQCLLAVLVITGVITTVTGYQSTWTVFASWPSFVSGVDIKTVCYFVCICRCGCKTVLTVIAPLRQPCMPIGKNLIFFIHHTFMVNGTMNLTYGQCICTHPNRKPAYSPEGGLKFITVMCHINFHDWFYITLAGNYDEIRSNL